MLESFVRLEDADVQGIASFALKWGLLGVERFRDRKTSEVAWDLEGAYSSRGFHSVLVWGRIREDRMEKPPDVCYILEPLHYWRFWIRQFASALRIAAALSSGRIPPQRDWECFHLIPDLSGFDPTPLRAAYLDLTTRCEAAVRRDERAAYDAGYEEGRQRLEQETSLYDPNPNYCVMRQKLEALSDEMRRESEEIYAEFTRLRAHPYWTWEFCRVLTREREDSDWGSAVDSFHRVLSEWQDMGRVEMRLVDGRLKLKTQTLFSALVWQMLSVVSSQAFSVCDGCHRTYSPKRQPRASARNYCQQCRKRGVPVRDAVRDHRQRRQQNQETAETRKRKRS